MTLDQIFDQLTAIESQLAAVERTRARISSLRDRFRLAGIEAPPALDECSVALTGHGDELAKAAVPAVELPVPTPAPVEKAEAPAPAEAVS